MTAKVDDAYVLSTSELGEADLIVTLLAEHGGRVRGVAASARRSRRRFGGALDPLTRVRASWVEREGRELHRIEGLEPLRSFSAMQSDPVRLAACAVLSEITSTVAQEGQEESRSFRLLGAVLDALEAGLDAWVAVRYFEYWTLRLHGVLPDLEACAACERPVVGGRAYVGPAGRGLCGRCARTAGAAVRLTRRDAEFLSAVAASPPAAVAAFRDAARPGGACERLLLGALEAFADRAFRGYRHLRTLAS